jgi:lipopolysaccharide transport system ATP-binding protein
MKNNRVNNLISGRKYRYAYMVRFDKKAHNVRFGMLIKTISGFEIGGAMSAKLLNNSIETVEAQSVYRVEFAFNAFLNAGTYFLNAGVMGDVNGENLYLHRLIDIAMFRVVPDPANLTTGIVDFACVPAVQELEVAHDES